MSEFWQGLSKNNTLWVTILSWFISQGIKVILGLIREKRFNFTWLFRPGGMPSSHTAGVVTLTLSLGKRLGYSSPIFALSCIFAIMTMFDAQTWRRSIGVQAKILNRIMDDLRAHKKIDEERLRELIGHSPLEVLVGTLIGFLVFLIFYK